jgi:ATP phosphoribosyltransferase
MKNDNRIRIAVQKSGRLSDESFDLLGRCGIKIKSRRDQLFCHSENFPLDLLLVRDDDIPHLVMDGICDFGIVGTNVLEEKALHRDNNGKNKIYHKIRDLGFGNCRLSIAVPEQFHYENLGDLTAKRIATSYPYLLENFLKQNNVAAEVVFLSGAVEIAPRLGIADVICDLVSTGTTLDANNLREVETVYKSHAVLIKSNTFPEEKKITADSFERRLNGVLQANESKYIMLHAPKSALQKIVSLLPGVEHPTIVPLQGDSEKVALHAVCRESVFWETMENLKSAGASSILVLPVEKMLCD